MRRIIWILLIFAFHISQGQDAGEILRHIKTERQAERFIIDHPESNGVVMELMSIQDTSTLAKQLLAGNDGDVHTIENKTYKIIERKTTPLFRASYIYLDGKRLSIKEIDKIRDDILKKYGSGTAFADLVQQYTMDESKKQNGDLGWFKEGVMVRGFESAVREHRRGEIFTVDITESNWYYVVLKTHDNLEVTTATVLQVDN